MQIPIGISMNVSVEQHGNRPAGISAQQECWTSQASYLMKVTRGLLAIFEQDSFTVLGCCRFLIGGTK
jgi:hypothetical protein